MIIEANERGGAKDLALHLLKNDNDHVTVHDMRGFMSDDLLPAFNEMYAISRGTKAKKYLFSVSLNPPEGEEVSVEAFLDAIKRLDEEFGLEEQQRAIVFHEKNGRRHCHVVWSRIDMSLMKAIKLDYYKRRIMDISRSLYLEHGWTMPRGFMQSEERNPTNFTLKEHLQAKRSGLRAKDIKIIFQDCWAISDSLAAFKHALFERGFILAQGDRAFVALDMNGHIYSVARQLPRGINKKQLIAKLGEPKDLPIVEEARAIIAKIVSDRLNFLGYQQSSLIDERLKALSHKHQELVKAQKEAREQLKERQHQRWQLEDKVRQGRFRTGFWGLLDRVSSRHKAITRRNEQLTEKAKERDQKELDALIFKQVEQRRTLQGRIDRLKEFSKASMEQITHDLAYYEDLLGLDDREQPAKTDPAQPFVRSVDQTTLAMAQKVKDNPEAILELITRTKETFTERDIENGLSQYIKGKTELTKAIATVLISDELIEIEQDGKQLYTTHEMQRIKAAITDQAERLHQTKGFEVSKAHQQGALDLHNKLLKNRFGGKLSNEQMQAVTHITGGEQISIAVGLAGAGKSTMLDTANTAWQQDKRRVLGAAPSGKAADGLQAASGIESRTLAAWELLWKNERHELKQGNILVVDEAGMMGNRQMLRIMEEVKAKGAKLVLVGDPEQLQPIEAGTPLKEISKQIGAAKLSEIRRQKTSWQRKASQALAEGKTKDAIKTYNKQGAVLYAKKPDEAINTLVKDYLTHWDKVGTKETRIALAFQRDDVHAINQAIRAVKQEQGHFPDEQDYKTAHGPRKFAPGERIVFTKNDKELGVKNGMLGTVKAAKKNQITAEIDGETENQKLTFNASEYNAFDHGYATTIHKSQGMTVDQSFVLHTPNMDKHLTYVAMTRHKSGLKLYRDQSQGFNQQWRDVSVSHDQSKGPSLER